MVVKLASPVSFSVPVPKELPSSSKVTVPVGVPEPGLMALTIAIIVTDCPKTGAATFINVVVVLACLTVCVKIADVLPAKCVSAP